VTQQPPPNPSFFSHPLRSAFGEKERWSRHLIPFNEQHIAWSQDFVQKCVFVCLRAGASACSAAFIAAFVTCLHSIRQMIFITVIITLGRDGAKEN